MEKSILFQQKKIYYTIAGKGPALILLHGFMESRAIWESFTGKLILHFTVISIDLPGHGDSEILAETYTMSLMAHAVKAVLANENISSCVVCGHSMGGYTALQLASEEPDLFKGLVLFHSQAAADSEEAREKRLHTIQIVKQNHKGFIKQFIPDLFDQKHIAKYTDAIRELQETASLMKPEAINAALAGMRDRENHLELLYLPKCLCFLLPENRIAVFLITWYLPRLLCLHTARSCYSIMSGIWDLSKRLRRPSKR